MLCGFGFELLCLVLPVLYLAMLIWLFWLSWWLLGACIICAICICGWLTKACGINFLFHLPIGLVCGIFSPLLGLSCEILLKSLIMLLGDTVFLWLSKIELLRLTLAYWSTFWLELVDKWVPLTYFSGVADLEGPFTSLLFISKYCLPFFVTNLKFLFSVEYKLPYWSLKIWFLASEFIAVTLFDEFLLGVFGVTLISSIDFLEEFLKA